MAWLLTVLLLAGQDGTLRRYRHHRSHCIVCVHAFRHRPLCAYVLGLAEVGDRGLIIHDGHCGSVEDQARRGALSHNKQRMRGDEGQVEGAGVKVAGVRK